MSPHPALAVLDAAAVGRFPPVDGRVESMPPDQRGTWAIVEFTGHALVLSDRPASDVLFDGVDAFGGVTQPRFVLDLAGSRTDIGSHDAFLVRPGGAPVEPLPVTDSYDDHPRVVRSRHHRSGVRVHGDRRGLVTIGSGLVGRTELSVEVVDAHAAGGTGRELILGGLATVPSDQYVFAQVALGNAASMRAFLACEFTPIGSEILIEP